MKTPALSIRQPWAWLILHAGKDIENRSWKREYTGRILIHAGTTMTRGDYEESKSFAKQRGVTNLPSFEELKKTQCGGIVGEVTLDGYVTKSKSKWYSPKNDGHVGFVLSDPKPCKIKPCKGKRQFFEPEYDYTDCQKFLRKWGIGKG